MNYRKEIDGLRAFAVLCVVFFHAFPSRLSGGFLGVDIFFVISGFLISNNLYKMQEKGNLRFLEFYNRRIRRLLPSLIVVLFVVLIIGWFFLFEEEFKELGRHLFGAAGFSSNILLSNEVGYFDKQAEIKPLLHLWSLAIEEQFYLIWPFVLWLISYRRISLFLAINLFIMISFFLNLYFGYVNLEKNFYNPFSRGWELLLGSLIAYFVYFKNYQSFLSKKQANFLSLIGVILMFIGVLFYEKNMQFEGFYIVFPLVGASLIILAGESSWINVKIFSHPYIVWFGLISFPLYLWHWPLLSFARIIETGEPNRLIRFFLIIFSIVLAFLTYYFVEKPIRFSKRVPTIYLLTILFFIGLIGASIKNFEGFFKPRLAGVLNQKILNAANDWDFPGGLIHLKDYEIYGYTNSRLQSEVLVFGDSHAQQFGPRVEMLGKKNQVKPITFITAGGCIPGDKSTTSIDCLKSTQYFRDFLKKNNSVTTIIIAACWNCYFLSSEGDTNMQLKIEKSLESLKNFIYPLTKKYKVYVLLDNPLSISFHPLKMFPDVTSRKKLSFSSNIDYLIQKINEEPKKFNQDNHQIILERKIKKSLSSLDLIFISSRQLICPNNICSPVDLKGRPLYKDSNHYTSIFAREKVDILDRYLLNSAII